MAMKLLLKIYNEKRTEEKTELIKKLRPLLNIIDYEPADDLRELAEKIINRFPEFYFLKEFDIKVDYVRSFEAKKSKGRPVCGECRKVTGPYKAYLPYDFVVTFYEPNIDWFTENQRKILMLHELKHIEITERGLTVKPHDTEDWDSILREFGLRWNGYGQDVPDILAGGKNGGTKSNNLRTDGSRKTATRSGVKSGKSS